MRGVRGVSLGWLTAVAVAAAPVSAGAVPLDAKECRRISAEHQELVGEGVEAKLAKGAAWAKTNLTADDLDRIRHFLVLEEQLKFRCPELLSLEPAAPAAVARRTGAGIPMPLRKPPVPGRDKAIDAAPPPPTRP